MAEQDYISFEKEPISQRYLNLPINLHLKRKTAFSQRSLEAHLGCGSSARGSSPAIAHNEKTGNYVLKRSYSLAKHGNFNESDVLSGFLVKINSEDKNIYLMEDVNTKKVLHKIDFNAIKDYCIDRE